jgi:hypothetical protein
MLDAQIFPCSFERSVEGPRGTVLLRRNRDHVDAAVTAIRRRDTPAWSAGQGGRPWTPPKVAKRRRRRKS